MKKIPIIILLGLLAFSCTKDSVPEHDQGKPGDVTLSLSLFDFGQVDIDTRTYDPDAIVDITILQFVEGKCVAKASFAGADVTSSPAVALKSMAGNTPGNVMLVFCNFTELNGGTDPFVGVTTGSLLSILDAITVPFNATTSTTAIYVPFRGVYTGLINVGAASAIDITLYRMFAKIDFTLVNSFPGFTPLSVRLCQFADRVSANSTVPALGAALNPEGFTAFPTGATYANLDLKPVTGATTSKHLWHINENCMGTWNDVTLSGGATWSNFYKYPGAASTDNNYQQALADAPQGSYYGIAVTTPYIEVNGVATITASGVPASITYKIYLGGDTRGDMNILGNYIYYVTTEIKGVNGLDSRITTMDRTAAATALSPSNCYMIKADATSGTPAMKLGIPLIQAQYGQTAVANIMGTAAPTIDFTQTSVGVVWQTMAGSGDLQSSLGIDNTSVSFDPVGSYHIILDFSTVRIPSGHNAVIALYSGPNQTGNILWSWHLWFTDYQPNVSQFNKYGQMDYYLSNTTKAMMDRNLGATITGVSEGIALKMSTDATWAQNNAGKLYGLMYQWGRKDPFTGANGLTTSSPSPQAIYNKAGVLISGSILLGTVNRANMLATSVLNPLTFYRNSNPNYDWYTQGSTRNDNLWLPGTSATGNNPASNNPANSSKSIFDPCPPGWRVPIGGPVVANNPWAGFNGMALTGSVGNPTANYTYSSNGNTSTGLRPENPGIFQWYSQGKLPSGTAGLYSPASTHVTSGRLFSHDGTLAWYPATGYRHWNTGAFTNVGLVGYAWSSTVTGFNSHFLSYIVTTVYPQITNSRAYAFPVRCIQE